MAFIASISELLSGLLDEDFLLDDFESLLFFLAGLLDLDLDLDLEDSEPDFDPRSDLLLRRLLRELERLFDLKISNRESIDQNLGYINLTELRHIISLPFQFIRLPFGPFYIKKTLKKSNFYCIDKK